MRPFVIRWAEGRKAKLKKTKRPKPRKTKRTIHAFGFCSLTCDHEPVCPYQVAIARRWVECRVRKPGNSWRSGYGLKHLAESYYRAQGTPRYISNGAMLTALLERHQLAVDGPNGLARLTVLSRPRWRVHVHDLPRCTCTSCVGEERASGTRLVADRCA
jgi:hypothetical protein